MLRWRAEPDVNTEEGFQAAVAAAAGRSEEEIDALPEITETPDVRTGLSTDDTRNAAGRRIDPETKQFVPEQPAAPAPPEPPPAELPPAAETPPAEPEKPQYVLDLEKQIADAQAMIGRQAAEIGELRQRDDEPEYDYGPPPELPVANEQVMEQVGNMIDTYGTHGALDWLEENRPDLMPVALQVANEIDQGGARYWASTWQARQEPEAPAAPPAPQQDPLLAEMHQTRRATSAVQEVAALLGDEFAAVKPHILDAFKESPKLVQEAVLSEDEGLRAQGVQALAGLARGRAIQAPAAAVQAEQEEERKTVLQAAQVATGSQRPVAERQPGERPSVEERAARIEQFHKDLLATETTNVQDGLTFGNER